MPKHDWTHISEDWLSKEGASCFAERVERLNWLAARMPKSEYLLFSGGMMAKYLLEETRYCFVYGQYLAVIVLGVAFVERTLAAEFYASGRDHLERANISVLLREARDKGWLSTEEYEAFDRARRLRNPVTHFRRPGHDDSIEYRMIQENELPYAIIEQDARTIVSTVMNMLSRNAI
jgi:hypothetical protein